MLVQHQQRHRLIYDKISQHGLLRLTILKTFPCYRNKLWIVFFLVVTCCQLILSANLPASCSLMANIQVYGYKKVHIAGVADLYPQF